MAAQAVCWSTLEHRVMDPTSSEATAELLEHLEVPAGHPRRIGPADGRGHSCSIAHQLAPAQLGGIDRHDVPCGHQDPPVDDVRDDSVGQAARGGVRGLESTGLMSAGQATGQASASCRRWQRLLALTSTSGPFASGPSRACATANSRHLPSPWSPGHAAPLTSHRSAVPSPRATSTWT